MGNLQKLLGTEEKLSVLLAVQPVYAKNLEVKAFDILMDRPCTVADINSLLPIAETYNSIYQNGQLTNVSCFLKVGVDVLLDAELPDLPRRLFILELSVDVEPTEELVKHLRRIAGKGTLLALSGYRPELAPLLSVVHIVRLDIGALPEDELAAAVEALKPHNLDLFADNLQSPEQFRACLEAGFQYFRGDLISPPESGEGKSLGNNKVLLLQLLAELGNPESSLEALEQIIIRDANLTYKFLKAVNSATYSINKPIESLSYALVILGTVQIRRWASLFLLERNNERPEELVRQMLVRARMCEILAELTGQSYPARFFIVGLLSQLDLLTEIPMPDLMASVPLNQEIKDALLSRKGPMGAVLAEVEHYEKGEFDKLSSLPDRSYYEASYRHSTAWARQIQAPSSL